MIDLGDRILPQHLLVGDVRSEEPGWWTHIPMDELVPRLCKRLLEFVGMLAESLDDLPVVRVLLQRDVRRHHHGRVFLRRIVSIRNGVPCSFVFGSPLPGTGRTLHEFPLVLEQVVEIGGIPHRRPGVPGAFDPTGYRIRAFAGAVVALPAEPLLFYRGRFGIWTEVILRGSTVGFAEGVSTSDECDRFLVVHCHAAERLSDEVC